MSLRSSIMGNDITNCSNRKYEYITTNVLSKDQQIELAEVMASDDEEEGAFSKYLKWIEDEFKNIDNSRKLYVFAIYESKIIGFIRIWNSEYCNKYFNDGIVVKKEFYNQRIGYNLLLNGIQVAKKLGGKQLYAAINESNITSIIIHEKCGFKKIGIQKINSYGKKMYNKKLYEYKMDL